MLTKLTVVVNPTNPISQKYYLQGWQLDNIKCTTNSYAIVSNDHFLPQLTSKKYVFLDWSLSLAIAAGSNPIKPNRLCLWNLTKDLNLRKYFLTCVDVGMLFHVRLLVEPLATVLTGVRPIVNVTNILRAAYAPIIFYQKITRPNFKYVEKSRQNNFVWKSCS